MMQLNQNANAVTDFSKFDVYVKTSRNGFSRITRFVIGISVILAILMLTIR